MKIIFFISISIFTGGVFTLGSFFNGLTQTTEPVEVVKKYYELALKGEIDKALLLISTTNCNSGAICGGNLSSSESTDEKWIKQINQYQDKIVSVDDVNIQKNKAFVRVSTEDARGNKDKVIYKLNYNDGKWKIYALTSPALEEADKEVERIGKEKLKKIINRKH